MRRRRLPKDNFSDERWQEHLDYVARKGKLWAKAQPERWKDLDPWTCPELFAIYHALKGSLLPDLISELTEEVRKTLVKKGVDVDYKQAGIEIVVPLLWRFAGATLKFPGDNFLAKCFRDAQIWMEVSDAQNIERDAVIRSLAVRYDLTVGKVQKIHLRMSEEYGVRDGA